MESPFAEWLGAELDRRGWSQAEMGRRAGINHVSVHAWLYSGTRPDSNTCSKIARALGLPVIEVLYRAGHVPEEAREIDLTKVDWRVGLWAEAPPGEGDLIVDTVEALLEARRRRRSPRRARPPRDPEPHA